MTHSAVVIRVGFDYVTVVDGHWDVSGNRLTALNSLRKLVREFTEEGDTVALKGPDFWTAQEYIAEDRKEHPNYDKLSLEAIVIGSAMEDRKVTVITDDELQSCRDIARIVVDMVR